MSDSQTESSLDLPSKQALGQKAAAALSCCYTSNKAGYSSRTNMDRHTRLSDRYMEIEHIKTVGREASPSHFSKQVLGQALHTDADTHPGKPSLPPWPAE